MERKRSTRWIVICTLILGSASVSAQDSGNGGEGPLTDVFEAPTDLTACQVGYGETGEVRLTWSNPERFERVAAYVDGIDAELYVDGAHGGVVVQATPGNHIFEVEGFVGEEGSAEALLEFEVLANTPLPDPVSDLDCEYVPGAAGGLVIDWLLGADTWSTGEVRMGGRRGNIGFDSSNDFVEIMLAGDRPESVEVAFKEGSYFSEGVTIPCIQLIPAFRRSDCDLNGVVNITDPIYTVNHLFLSRPRWYCDDACDANDDGQLDLADALTTLRYLFQSEIPPVSPGPEGCGIDPTEDFLGGLCQEACAAPAGV